MKRLLLVCALAMSVAGCGLDEQGNSNLDKTVAKVRQYTTQICSFLPTIPTVVAMLTAANPTVTGALNIAQAICDVIATKPVPLMGQMYTENSCPKVNGVCVEGEKVK